MTASIFVGRELPLAQLQQFLDHALAGQGRVRYVTGEAGSGKTALVTEFARRALEQHHDLVAALGQCDAHTGAGDAYLPFREILAQLTGDVEGKLARGTISPENTSRLKKLLRFSGQALAEVGPDLIGIFVPGAGLLARAAAFAAEKAGWMDQLEKLAGHQAGRASDAPTTDLQQEHIFEQYTNVLRQLAQKQPLLLILDDLQWADTGSIDLLFRLSRRIADSPILLIGTYRPADVALGRRGGPHPLTPMLAESKRYFGEIEIDLAQVQEAEGRAFVDAFLNSEPNRLHEDFRQALYDHTQGHPLFTVELLRAMQERGDLVRDKQGRWVPRLALDWASLPARIEGVIEERIGRLEEELREALTVGSVEGETFTAEVIARVQDQNARQIVRCLSGELAKQHRLVLPQSSQRLGRQRLSLYRFQHNLFQKYLYNELDEVERACLHEDIGLVLEELYGEQAAEIAIQLAHHFQEAAMTEEARHYLHKAGEQAAARYANEEALRYLDRALELAPAQDPEGRLELLLSRDSIHNRLGQRDLQRSDLAEMESLIPQLDSVAAPLWQARTALRQAHLASQTDEHAVTIELAQKAIELATQNQFSSLEAKGYLHWGNSLWRLGDLLKARQKLERALSLSKSLGLRKIEADSLGSLGIVATRQGSYSEAEDYYQQAAAIFHEIGDRLGQIAALSNIAGILAARGEFASSKDFLEQAFQAAQEVGDRRGQSILLNNLAEVSRIQGDLIKAKSCLQQALPIHDEIGARENVAIAYFVLGSISQVVGDYPGAEASYMKSLQVAREIGDRRTDGHVLAYLGLLHHQSGQNESAVEYSQQGLHIAQEIGDRHTEAYALHNWAHACHALGRLIDAAQAFQQALEIRQEIGDHALAIESWAGLARVALDQGDSDQALAHVERILAYLQENTLDGTDEPFRIYLSCHQVLGAHNDPRAAEILRQAQYLLQERADRIRDEEMRHTFLNNVRVHRDIRNASP
jgi:predicted ATPase